jgi:hypothetical protein
VENLEGENKRNEDKSRLWRSQSREGMKRTTWQLSKTNEEGKNRKIKR